MPMPRRAVAPRPEPFAEFRKLFPGSDRRIYMNVSARGLIARPVRAAMDAFLDQRMDGSVNKAWMFERAEATRARFARLIGASPDEIAFTKNISEGINAFANALPWAEGDNVVLCESVEHPANILPWLNLQRRCGIGIKAVADADGHIPVERLIEAVDARTRVVSVSSISFSPGFRVPLAELAAECRARGVLLFVDAAQSIGLQQIDVETLGIDALVTSTQKGLLALYGAGFLHVRRAVADRMQPVYLSRAGAVGGAGHEAARIQGTDWDHAPGARRFDVGNHNFLALIAVERSMEMLEGLGIARVETHVRNLAQRLAVGVAEAGLPLFGDVDDPRRAHIVCVGHGLSDEHDSTRDKRMADLHQWLEANGVALTIRRGLLRFSLHGYNDTGDVDATLDLIRRWPGRSGTA